MSRAAIEGLVPEAVWERFYQISRIPRESGKEEGIRDWILGFARERDIESYVDGAGNVILKTGAAPGYEGLPRVILQGHLDMVCEKNRGTEHDFSKDPIVLQRRGDWLSADGTTLGADNGIALALILALFADDSLPHGPLEALLTVDEETGLKGALECDPLALDGRILINLDSEEEDILYIGCAGGANTEGELPVKWKAAPSGWSSRGLSITGLAGGHSGNDIHKNRGNALLMGAAILTALRLHGAKLASLSGGGKHNVIPRECFADFLLPPGKEAEAEGLVKKLSEGFLAEWQDIEPDLSIQFTEVQEAPQEVLTDDSFQRVGDLLFAMPHGVAGMSRKLKDLVETSTNLAQARLEKDRLYLLTSQRSSSDFLRDNLCEKVMACVRAAGGAAWVNSLYPGWDPNPASPLLAVSRRAFRDVMGKEPLVKAIHAGLECGVIGKKIPGLDMISFGPDIEMAHTPEERLKISSVGRIWNLLLAVLSALK